MLPCQNEEIKLPKKCYKNKLLKKGNYTLIKGFKKPSVLPTNRQTDELGNKEQ